MLDKRRPVLVLSRQDVIGLLRSVMVAPITSAIRGAPSEVTVGTDEGLKGPSAVEKRLLSGYVGSLSIKKMRAVCDALAVAVGCER